MYTATILLFQCGVDLIRPNSDVKNRPRAVIVMVFHKTIKVDLQLGIAHQLTSRVDETQKRNAKQKNYPRQISAT